MDRAGRIPKIMASSSSISTIALMNLPSGLLKSRKGGFIHYKSTRPQCSSKPDFRNFEKDSDVRISQFQETGSVMMTGRRSMIGLTWLVSSLGIAGSDGGGGCAVGAGLPMEEKPKLCDKDCEAELENIPMITTESGLQYKEIIVGQGPSPPVGFQVAANYVAMVPSGQIFDSSLEKNTPYIFRVGSDQVIKGLDEGILSMKVGGKRRLYIPGSLAFPKGLNSAPGRPRVSANSPVIFDVSLVFVPGLDD